MHIEIIEPVWKCGAVESVRQAPLIVPIVNDLRISRLLIKPSVLQLDNHLC